MKGFYVKQFLLICLFTACLGAAIYRVSEYLRIQEEKTIVITNLQSVENDRIDK